MLSLGACGGANTEDVGYDPRPPAPQSSAANHSLIHVSNSDASYPIPLASDRSPSWIPTPEAPDSSGPSLPAAIEAAENGTSSTASGSGTGSGYAAGGDSSHSSGGRGLPSDLSLPELLAKAASSMPELPSTPCAGMDPQIVVVTSTHRLFLCDQGRAESFFDVSFGVGGLYKHRDGDGKTPIGIYSLSPPFSSSLVHLFIPIGYPNAADLEYAQNHGISNPGGAIGIHGPALSLLPRNRDSWPRDWTDGCIGTSTDADIDAIGSWVTRHPGATIDIEPPSS